MKTIDERAGEERDVLLKLKKPLTKEDVEFKMTIGDCYKYYFPGASEKEIDFFIWEKTPYPFDIMAAVDSMYRRYKSIMISLFIDGNLK